jgi:hypothetical protein
MRPTMVSLLAFLLLTGSSARAQVLGSIDPTDLKVRVPTIDSVRYELLLPPNARILPTPEVSCHASFMRSPF